MADFDIIVPLRMIMVIRGATDETEAKAIARKLADQFCGVSQEIDGSAYGQPKVTEFSVNDSPDVGELEISPLEE